MISICSIWLNSSIPSFSFHSPAAITPRLRSRLHTFIADLVKAQADCFYGLVDAKRVGEGLQSWHEAKAKWTADPSAFHCSCAELPALSTGSSACQDRHWCPLMSDPHVTIQPHSILHISSHLCGDLLRTFFSSLSSLTAIPFQRKYVQKPHTPSRKRIRSPNGQWTSKLLRLRSLSHLANGPWNKSLNFIFLTKYIILKSLKFSYWSSKL